MIEFSGPRWSIGGFTLRDKAAPMALTIGVRGDTASRIGTRRSPHDWLVLLVRTLLVAYLAAIGALHLVTVPAIYDLQRTACEPGACIPGQLNQDTLAWLAERGISAALYSFTATFLILLIPIIGNTLAAVAIWQRPTAWLPMVFVVAIATCSLSASGALYVFVANYSQFDWVLTWGAVPMVAIWPLMPALFPNGRFIPRWSILLVAVSIVDLVLLFRPAWSASLPGWVITVDTWAWVAAAVICIPWRLHVTTPDLERQQTRIWAVALAPLLINTAIGNVWGVELESGTAAGGFPAIANQFVWAVSIVWLLTGFMLAVYLYRLYDLTMIVRRSLVYGLLSVALIGLYLLTTAALAITFRSEDALLTSLVATVVIALAFAPLRDHLQSTIRRLLYGDQHDPYGVLTRFGEHLERESVPERLLRSVVDLAQDSLRVPGVALAVTGSPDLGVRTGTIGGSALKVPVRYQGEGIGELAVAPRSPGEAFSPADHRLIDEIARQMGIAVHSILLSEDLRHSRERIVTAREEERRRIRRDLHDGLGPSLAALSLQVEIARDMIDADPLRSTELLDTVLFQARESILDVRRLVYDLRPPALDDLGLFGAIKAQRHTWEQCGLQVTLDLAANFPPLSAATEVAIYRIVQEAVNNVIHHAGATVITITLASTPDGMHLEIADDGRGLPTPLTAGVGLLSMRERAAELGGTCDIISTPGHGVCIRATFAVGPPIQREVASHD